jgi:hypothetical protein
MDIAMPGAPPIWHFFWTHPNALKDHSTDKLRLKDLERAE